jgi:hypothetical protein
MSRRVLQSRLRREMVDSQEVKGELSRGTPELLETFSEEAKWLQYV